ncbi:MAG TPA: hypothetical protein PLK05_12760, partial [Steroidobacteraceae bacterium]|nr:hypothetical protein [Steroidobacteraceae bacterium]
MSIVERALKRLQQSSQAAAEAARPPAAPVQRKAGPAASPPRMGRETVVQQQIGNPEKSIHIDFDQLRHAGLLPPEHQQREIAHQYRLLKRPILKYAFGADAPPAESRAASPRTLMVTSALPGEGKTFTAINLALSLALEKDHSVVLVDGDAPKPHVSQAFGIGSEPGLLDLLINPAMQVKSAVLPTDVRGLYLLPIG